MKLKQTFIKLINQPAFLALIFTLPTMMVFLCTEPKLSGAGDLNIAEFIMSGDKIRDGFFYISPILSKFLKLLSAGIYVNWWSIYSVTIYGIALFLTSWFIASRMTGYHIFKRIYVLAAFVFLYWELILKNDISFNYTATVAFLAGLVLLIYYASEKCHWPAWVAVLLFWLAGETRKKAFYMAVPFGVMVLMYYYIFPLKSENLIDSVKESWKCRKKFVVAIGILVGSLVLVLGAYKVYNLDPSLKYRDELNSAAHLIDDYQDRYPKYSENEDLYKSVGIPQSWVNMINSFIFSDKNVFTPDTFGLMITLRGESTIKFSAFFDYFRNQKILGVLLIVFAIMMFKLVGKKKSLIPLLGSLLGICGCTLFCVFVGRITTRLIVSYLLCAVFSLFAMCFSEENDPQEQKISLHGNLEFGALCLLIIVVMFAIVKDEKGSVSLPKSAVVNESQANALDCIDKDNENVYLYGDMIRFTGSHNLWSGHAPEYLDNYFPLSSCFVLGSEESLAKFGVTDLYRSIITMPNVKVENQATSTEALFYYLRDFYNPQVAMSIVENFGGNLYLRYAGPVQPSTIMESGIECKIEENTRITTVSNTKAMYDVNVTIPDDEAAQYDDILVNVYCEDGSQFSYGLNYKDASAYGTIIFSESDPLPENARAVIVGRGTDSEYYILADLRDCFTKENEE